MNQKVNRVVIQGLGFPFAEETVKTSNGLHTQIKELNEKLSYEKQDEALVDCLENNADFFRASYFFRLGAHLDQVKGK